MKRVLLLVVVVFLSFEYCFSRDKDYSYYGVSIDLGLSFIDNGCGFSLTDDDIEVLPMGGFDIGFYMQQQLYKRLVLVSGFKYQFSGVSKSSENPFVHMEEEAKDINLINNAFVIPIKIGFSTPLPHNWFFSVYAGPSLDFNFVTTEKYKYRDGTYKKYDWVNGKYRTNRDGQKIRETSSEHKYLKMFDVPIGFGLTFRRKFIGIKLEYEYGLIDRYKGKFEDIDYAQWHSHQASLGVLFVF